MDSQTLQHSPSQTGIANTVIGHTPVTGSLSVAVDRLDRALEALESRLKGLSVHVDTQVDARGGDEALRRGYQQALEELEAVRERERDLTEAADGAYQTLKLAAANIRLLLSHEAA